MARPTDDNKSKYIGIRINAETLDFLRKNGGNVSEIARNLLYDYVKQNNGSVKHKNSNVKQNTDNSVKQNESFVKQYDSLKAKFDLLHSRVRPEADKYFKNEQYTMLEIVPVGYKGVNTTSESVNTDKFVELSEDLRMPYDVMYSEIKRLTDSGELMKEGMGFAVHEHGLDIKDFLEVCKEVGKDAQKCLNGFTDSLRKGNRST